MRDTNLHDFGDFELVITFHQKIIFSETDASSNAISGCQNHKFLEKSNKTFNSYDKFKIAKIIQTRMRDMNLPDFGLS